MAALVQNVISVGQPIGETVNSAFEEFNCCGFASKSKVVRAVLSISLSLLETAICMWALTEFWQVPAVQKSHSVAHWTYIWQFCQIFNWFICVSKVSCLVYYLHILRISRRIVSPSKSDIKTSKHSSDFAVELQTVEIWNFINGIAEFIFENLGINFAKVLIGFQSFEATQDLQTTSAQASGVVSVAVAVLQLILQMYGIMKHHKNIAGWAKSLELSTVIAVTCGAMGPDIYSLGISFDFVTVLHNTPDDIQSNTEYLIVWTVVPMVGAFILVQAVIWCLKKCCKTNRCNVCLIA